MADAQQAHVVAECGPETARLEEVTLHVDDHQRGGGGIKREVVWFGLNLCMLASWAESLQSGHRSLCIAADAASATRLLPLW